MQSFINPQSIKATLIDQTIKNGLFNQTYKRKSKFTPAFHSKTKYPSSRNEQSATKINIKKPDNKQVKHFKTNLPNRKSRPMPQTGIPHNSLLYLNQSEH
ncbi:hypothetical protein [Laribacter hongkongensis]|uniref:hypothetical protein n=1 Tax=Laribacter hongkongensis TaxID=168471 RepID=UPI00117DF630|nr:hypothetical protein [Laribacter hongkongensis]